MKFSMKYLFSVIKSEFPLDLVTFTKEILNRKLHFLCSDLKLELFLFFDTVIKTVPFLKEQ